jgi:hypothetical protein
VAAHFYDTRLIEPSAIGLSWRSVNARSPAGGRILQFIALRTAIIHNADPQNEAEYFAFGPMFAAITGQRSERVNAKCSNLL